MDMLNENRYNLYFISEDHKYDITNLKPVHPSDEYYLIDHVTSSAIKMDYKEVRELFSHSKDELKSILNDVIRENILQNLDDVISLAFSRKVDEYFKQFKHESKFFEFKGEFQEVPELMRPGEIAKVGDRFYFYDMDRMLHSFLTVENARQILEEYYDKNETDQLLAELLTAFNEVKSEVSGMLQQASSLSAFYVDLDRYDQLLTTWRDERINAVGILNKQKESIQNYATEYARLDSLYSSRLNSYDARMNAIELSAQTIFNEINSQDFQDKLNQMQMMNEKIDDLNVRLDLIEEMMIAEKERVDAVKSNTDEKISAILSSVQKEITE